MNPEIDPLYVEARQVLLDALDALAAHLDAVIVVGAQAVYLRTGAIDLAIAPFTTDGDLALDPSRLEDEPTLGDAMDAAGFRLEPHDKPEPGIWLMTRRVNGKDTDFPVDLIVPSDFATKAGRRGARLGSHGKLAARKIPGLEAAVLDNSELEIASLGKSDDRDVKAKVAGPTALLIAKSHKIQERLENMSRPDRVLDKDAGDAYRLMQTSDPRDCALTAARLMEDQQIGKSVRSGVEFFTDQFRASGSSGTAMAIRYFRGAIPEERVRAICTGFASEFVGALEK
jgi:hypothetical protein